MTSISNAVPEGLRQAAERVAAGHGLEIFDVQFRRESIGWVLRVILDRPARLTGARAAGGAAEEPVTIDDCKHVSQDLSALLDVEPDLVGGIDRSYTLEVSSPGLDRPLRGTADYQRFTGRLAKIVTQEPIDGQSAFSGRLAGLEGDTLLVAEGRRTHRIPVAAIRRAKLEVEF